MPRRDDHRSLVVWPSEYRPGCGHTQSPCGLSATGIREATGCSVVALEVGGQALINPPPETVLAAGAEIILIGATEAERRFVKKFAR